MNRKRWLLRRFAVSLLALWFVFSATFFLVALTGDPNEAVVEYGVAQELAGSGASEAEIEEAIEEATQAYRDARNLDEPITDRYVSWMSNLLRLDLGFAFSHPQPVTSLLVDRLAITLGYLVPGLAIALVGGTVLGTYTALGNRPVLTHALRVGSYGVFGLPNFWLAMMAIAIGFQEFGFLFLTGYELERGVLSTHNAKRLVLPALLVGTGLMAEQARFVRASILERHRELFVALVRAKGGSETRVAIHVLRNEFVSLSALFVSTLLGVLLVNVFVIEYVFNIPGFGLLSYNAILDRDLPVIVGMTLVVAIVGIGGNFLQDVVAASVDPRVVLTDE